MKKIIEVSEEGLIGLMGQRITLFCMNYIYTGKLVGVNDYCVLLDEPSIVYETGEFNNSTWKDAQRLPNTLYVVLSSVEAFGVIK